MGESASPVVVLKCVQCGRLGSEPGCKHNGSWHSAYNDCSLRCARGLGWGGLGRQHWSCCFSTSEASLCAKAHHLYSREASSQRDLGGEELLAAEGGASSGDLGRRSDCARFQINLDAKPRERWRHIVEAHLGQLSQILQIIEDVIGTGFAASTASAIFTGLTKAGRFYYGEELQGIAEATKLSIGQVALIQVAYEVFAACTSIVVDVDGALVGGTAGVKTPFHIRTMDWPMENLEKLTIEVDFVRGGQVVYSATTWPGYVGILTGVRPSCFSISVNYRRTQRGSENMLKAVIGNMLQGLASSWPVSFLVREVLETDGSYERALGSLQASELMAPTYIVVAGVREGQGAVITRSRNPSVRLPPWVLATNGPVVQTNHDWFADDEAVSAANGEEMGAPENISHSYERAHVARKAIESLGTVTPHDLWLLLSWKPCRADDTVYTVAMHPASGSLVTRASVLDSHERDGIARWGKLVRRELRTFAQRPATAAYCQ